MRKPAAESRAKVTVSGRVALQWYRKKCGLIEERCCSRWCGTESEGREQEGVLG